MRRNKSGRGRGEMGRGRRIVIYKKLKDYLTEMVAFEQSHAGGEGLSQVCSRSTGREGTVQTVRPLSAEAWRRGGDL